MYLKRRGQLLLKSERVITRLYFHTTFSSNPDSFEEFEYIFLQKNLILLNDVSDHLKHRLGLLEDCLRGKNLSLQLNFKCKNIDR